MATRWGQPEGAQFPDRKDGSKMSGASSGRFSEGTLPPEVHYQVSKKIAQLTKVIFTLNARLDEQESMMEALKDAYEERLQQLLVDTKQKIAQYKSKANSATELQHKITEMESMLTLEKAGKDELVEALKNTREKKLNEQSCKSCGINLSNGMYSKPMSKEFDNNSTVQSQSPPMRNKEEELEIIERILRKKSNAGSKLEPQSKSTNSKVKHMVDIPEKDGSMGAVTPPSPARPHGSRNVKVNDASNNKTPTVPSPNNLDSENSHWLQREKELLDRLSDNQKETQRLKDETRNLSKIISTTEAELKRFQQKASVRKNSITAQTDVCINSDVETQTESELLNSPDLTDKAKKVEKELKTTLEELQSLSSALNATKTQIHNTHLELRRLSSDEQHELRRFSLSSQRVGVQEENDIEGSSSERTKTELKDKVSELLEQVTMLMTNGGNMSDAEKENAELQKKLSEREEGYKKLLAAKDSQIADKELQLKRLETELTRQHNLAIEVILINHRREVENVVRLGEEKWQAQKEELQREHDTQLRKVQEEVNEMSRRLQSQTEMQTAELSRLNHDLDEAVNSLRQKDEDMLLQETKWSKEFEEKQESFQEQMKQAQKQSDQFLKQLDQKRDEVLQVRREATQQIRNLENYWLEKVNQELNRLKRAFTEEKKKMLESFCKSQRLLKDKIIALQSHEFTEESLNNLNKDDEIEDSNLTTNRKEANRIRRDSIVSQIEFPMRDNDLIDFTEALEKVDERICASQPNVTQLPPQQPRIINKKCKHPNEPRFIKRAESVFLPKLQFLSFWKSASSLDKAQCQKHRDTSSSNPAFPKDLPPSPTVNPPDKSLSQMTPELDPRKKAKMSPTFFRNRSSTDGPIGYEGFAFQDARSNSCFNLSCKSVFGTEGFSILNKTKRNSVGSNSFLGVVPEAPPHDSEEHGNVEENSCIKETKEPLLESEL